MIIECACGCGELREDTDKRGHKRKYIFGHQNKGKKGKSNHLYGKPRSEKTRKKIGDAQRGEKNHNYGKTASEETRNKMSQSHKGKHIGKDNPMYGKKTSNDTRKKQSDALKGEKCYWYGKKLSDNTRKKISEANKGKLKGENNPNWNNGSSFLPYCHKFNENLKEAVRKRDDRLCQNCGVKENGNKHNVHHIHYDKGNCYPNLITLCTSCNVKANSNRDMWESYYMNKLNDRGLLHWTLINFLNDSESDENY